MRSQLALTKFVSGCRESNPDLIHPMDIYYRYTTARDEKEDSTQGANSSQEWNLDKARLYRNVLVGAPGIEPGLYAPEAHVLPVYYAPIILSAATQ